MVRLKRYASSVKNTSRLPVLGWGRLIWCAKPSNKLSPTTWLHGIVGNPLYEHAIQLGLMTRHEAVACCNARTTKSEAPQDPVRCALSRHSSCPKIARRLEGMSSDPWRQVLDLCQQVAEKGQHDTCCTKCSTACRRVIWTDVDCTLYWA